MKNSIVGAKAQLVEDAKVTLGKSVENDHSQKFKIKGDNNQITNITVNVTPTVLKEMLQDGNNEETNKELQTVRNQLESELNEIPEEKRVTFKEADMGIIKDSLDNYYLNWNKEELRNYWKKMITKSFNKDTYSKIEPSFIDAIKSLSQREAQILNKWVKSLGLNFQIPICASLNRHNKRIKGSKTFNRGYIVVHKYFTTYLDLELSEQAKIISNLIRLGICEIPFDQHLIKNTEQGSKPIDEYDNIKTKLLQKLNLTDNEAFEYKTNNGILILTPFGKEILSIVCDEREDFSDIIYFI